ncbi:MAG: hypothetical protein LWX11_08425 [Firmicutes bacterium]|nr:hypothetical protein [Bacillota bacterium]
MMHDDHPHDGPCGCSSGRLACPRCGALGNGVARSTVERFIAPEALATLGFGEIRFCANPQCAVAYYAPLGTAVFKDQLSVRLGLKESQAPRPICHCFGHSIESLEAEWKAKGSVSAIIDVMGKVRAGECRCGELNPQGTCCLGELRQVVLALQNLPSAPEPEPEDDDCGGCSGCG